MIPVRVITSKREAVLIEVQDGGNLRRLIIPESYVKDGQVSEDDLDRAIPYGVPWELYLKPIVISPEDISNALKSNGVWTIEDFRNNPSIVHGAIMQAARSILRGLNVVVRQIEDRQ